MLSLLTLLSNGIPFTFPTPELFLSCHDCLDNDGKVGQDQDTKSSIGSVNELGEGFSSIPCQSIDNGSCCSCKIVHDTNDKTGKDVPVGEKPEEKVIQDQWHSLPNVLNAKTNHNTLNDHQAGKICQAMVTKVVPKCQDKGNRSFENCI